MYPFNCLYIYIHLSTTSSFFYLFLFVSLLKKISYRCGELSVLQISLQLTFIQHMEYNAYCMKCFMYTLLLFKKKFQAKSYSTQLQLKVWVNTQDRWSKVINNVWMYRSSYVKWIRPPSFRTHTADCLNYPASHTSCFREKTEWALISNCCLSLVRGVCYK